MRILVLNPPAFRNRDYIREGRCMQTKSSWAALWMPLSLCYIAAVLRKGGHQVKLTDAIASRMNNDRIVRDNASFDPQLIILNTAIPSIKGDMECASILKKAFPQVKIAVTGVFPSIYENESLEAYPQIDYAIMDEPEWISERLPEIIEGNCSPESVKGLIFRKGDEIIVNERQNLGANNLDELPFPARDLLDNNKYRLPTNGQKFTLLSVEGVARQDAYSALQIFIMAGNSENVQQKR